MDKKEIGSDILLMKKGQVTLFVILAMIIVVGIILFFVIRNNLDGSKDSAKGSVISPESYIENCLGDMGIYEKISNLGYSGGELENVPKIKFEFENELLEEIPYLCYTPENYKTCNVLEPMLINHLSEKLKEELERDSMLKICWNSLKENYQKEGYVVEENYEDIEIKLVPNKLIISLIKPYLSLTQEQDSFKIESVEIEFPTKLYNNAFVAIEISNQQSKYGSFNEMGYMALYPETDIRWTSAPNDTKIYTIKNKETLEVFRFAIRSLVPSGEI